MRLMSLNIWGGELYQPLLDFLNKYKDETDIFCFQEVFKNDEKVRNPNSEKIITFHGLKDILSGFSGYFEDYVAPGEYDKEGLAVFVKNGIEVKDSGEIFIYNPPNIGLSNNDPESLWRNLQHVRCGLGDKELVVANMHGLFDPAAKSHKDDTPERLEQSKKVKEFLDKFDCPKILCGDFNLWPDTDSIKIFEENMINLIKEYNVNSTRSAFFVYPNKFADYVFVSPNVSVIDFQILEETVSDHLAMRLEFSL